MVNYTNAVFSDGTDLTPYEDAIHVGDLPTTSGKIDFQYSILTGAIFEGITLDGAVFKGATLGATNFKNTTLKNVDFTGTDNLEELIFDVTTSFENVTLGTDSNNNAIIIGTAGSSLTVGTDVEGVLRNALINAMGIDLGGNQAVVNNILLAMGFSTAQAQMNHLTSVAVGDPYIYSMRSSTPVKLPDLEATYRLYQANNTFINAEVSIATKEHEKRMMRFVEKLGHDTKNVIADGYFFSKFYIVDGNNKMLVDLNEKSFSLLEGTSKTFFHISENRNDAGSKDWNGKSDNVIVEWVTEEGNQMKATIHFFKNPHIENGISLSVSNLPKKALGLCVNNYRPKLMRVPSLTTEQYNKIAKQIKKSRNPFQKIAIKSNREGWIMRN